VIGVLVELEVEMLEQMALMLTITISMAWFRAEPFG